MPGIQMNVTGATTFAQIEQRFSMDQGGKDHHIRFQDGQGLYTSNKASLASIKSFFGFPAQLENRQDKRDKGVDQIKQAIDNQYGQGFFDRVLNHIDTHSNVDLSHGIKRSDLGMIRDAIDTLTLQDKADIALGDPNTGLGRGTIDKDQLVDYFGKHFDACSSPEFWSHRNARANADNFGCALSLAVLDRIAGNGVATKKDLEDLHRVLGPFEAGHSPAPDVPDHLLGPVTDTNLREFTQLVFDRYMGPGAHFQINFDGQPHQRTVTDTFAGPANGNARLTAMHSALELTLGGQYMGQDNILEPLRGIR